MSMPPSCTTHHTSSVPVSCKRALVKDGIAGAPYAFVALGEVVDGAWYENGTLAGRGDTDRVDELVHDGQVISVLRPVVWPGQHTSVVPQRAETGRLHAEERASGSCDERVLTWRRCPVACR